MGFGSIDAATEAINDPNSSLHQCLEELVAILERGESWARSSFSINEKSYVLSARRIASQPDNGAIAIIIMS